MHEGQRPKMFLLPNDHSSQMDLVMNGFDSDFIWLGCHNLWVDRMGGLQARGSERIPRQNAKYGDLAAPDAE